MNIVDSSGWLEYFGKGKNGEIFFPIIQKTKELIVPTITIYEVFKRVSILRNEEDALKAVGIMTTGMVVDLSQEIAIQAAILSIEKKLPMADSLIMATSYYFQATLWTQDEHFKGMDGVEYIQK